MLLLRSDARAEARRKRAENVERERQAQLQAKLEAAQKDDGTPSIVKMARAEEAARRRLEQQQQQLPVGP